MKAVIVNDKLYLLGGVHRNGTLSPQVQPLKSLVDLAFSP